MDNKINTMAGVCTMYTFTQVNHLGYFFISLELLPCMISTEGDKRIVLVSSSATKAAGVWDPSNLHGDIGYGRLKFYSNSKLYNVSDSLTNIN